jgi:hypothetical protein
VPVFGKMISAFSVQNGTIAKQQTGEKTALFEPFIYKMHYFTKTGSGQS